MDRSMFITSYDFLRFDYLIWQWSAEQNIYDIPTSVFTPIQLHGSIFYDGSTCCMLNSVDLDQLAYSEAS